MIGKSIKYLVLVLVLFFFMGFKTTKPKIFVIGDSISMHYGPYLEKSLIGFFEYDRKGKNEKEKNLDNPNGANGGDSKMVLSYMKKLKGNKDFMTDYLLINCGLHDIKKDPKSLTNQIPLSEYLKNLQQIIVISKELKTKLIWINSTPVVDSVHNNNIGFRRYNNDVIKYNSMADSIMTVNNIPKIDLYTFTQKFIPEGFIDHVHYKEEVRQHQANFIAGYLVAIINSMQK